METSPRWRIALLVHSASAWTRQILAGVAEYARERGGWEFWMEPRGYYEKMILPEQWLGDGVLCRLNNEELAKQLARRKLPAVNVSWLGEHSPIVPKVISDEVACGELAANYFRQQNWGQFAFVGPPPSLDYSNRVETAFFDRLGVVAHSQNRFDHHPEFGTLNIGPQRPQLLDWLHNLPKPVALLVWTTTIGHEITLCCRELGLSVPDDVAILAVEVDPLVSALSPIPIAYIDQSPRRLGFRAAELLEQMIAGEPAPDEAILIPPRGIAERMSVDTLVVDDEIVRKAILVIRERLSQSLQVSELASAVHCSRRVLEKRFEKALNRTPAQVIRRTKLSHAMHLLSETELAIQEVAFGTGFEHVETFLRFFKRECGSTPTEYRKSLKLPKQEPID